LKSISDIEKYARKYISRTVPKSLPVVAKFEEAFLKSLLMSGKVRSSLNSLDSYSGANSDPEADAFNFVLRDYCAVVGVSYEPWFREAILRCLVRKDEAFFRWFGEKYLQAVDMKWTRGGQTEVIYNTDNEDEVMGIEEATTDEDYFTDMSVRSASAIIYYFDEPLNVVLGRLEKVANLLYLVLPARLPVIFDFMAIEKEPEVEEPEPYVPPEVSYLFFVSGSVIYLWDEDSDDWVVTSCPSVGTEYLEMFKINTGIFIQDNEGAIFRWSGKNWVLTNVFGYSFNSNIIIDKTSRGLYWEGGFWSGGVWVPTGLPSSTRFFEVSAGIFCYCPFEPSYIMKWGGSSWVSCGNDHMYASGGLGSVVDTSQGSFITLLSEDTGMDVLRWNGTSWVGTNIVSKDDLNIASAGIIVETSGGVFISRGNHGIQRWNGYTWVLTNLMDKVYYSIVGTSKGIFATGGFTGVKRWGGSLWDDMGVPDTGTGVSIVETSGGIFLCTDTGIMKLSGSSWVVSVSGSYDSVVENPAGIFAFFKGFGGPVLKLVNGVWVDAGLVNGGNVGFGGMDNLSGTFEGEDPEIEEPEIEEPPQEVNFLFATNYYGIYLWDEGEWLLTDCPSTGPYNSLISSSLGIFIQDNIGTVFKWNGESWDVAGSEIIYGSLSSFADTSQGVFFYSAGNIYRWSGSTWTFQSVIGDNKGKEKIFETSQGIFAFTGTNVYRWWSGSTWEVCKDFVASGDYNSSHSGIYPCSMVETSQGIFLTIGNMDVYKWNGSTWVGTNIYQKNVVWGFVLVETSQGIFVSPIYNFMPSITGYGVWKWDGVGWVVDVFPGCCTCVVETSQGIFATGSNNFGVKKLFAGLWEDTVVEGSFTNGVSIVETSQGIFLCGGSGLRKWNGSSWEVILLGDYYVSVKETSQGIFVFGEPVMRYDGSIWVDTGIYSGFSSGDVVLEV